MFQRVNLLLIFFTLLPTNSSPTLFYPASTVFQLTFGLSTPVELNLRNRAMIYSVGFQLQYALPYNITQLEPTIAPARASRESTLQDTYTTIENFLEENGWKEGRECLLRSICELAETPLERDGQEFVEEVIHLLLTHLAEVSAHILRTNATDVRDTFNCHFRSPFSTIELALLKYPEKRDAKPSEDLPEAFDFNHRSVHEMYHEAERIGKAGGDCILAYPDCIKSPLESFTEVLRPNQR